MVAVLTRAEVEAELVAVLVDAGLGAEDLTPLLQGLLRAGFYTDIEDGRYERVTGIEMSPGFVRQLVRELKG